MGSEDFSLMLQQRPGCYFSLGIAPLPEGGAPECKELLDNPYAEIDLEPYLYKDAISLHHPAYDFNDDAIPVGATVFARLVERYLSSQGADK